MVKMDTVVGRWKNGLWLQLMECTCDPIIDTEIGVIMCRDISPFSGEKSLDTDLIHAMKGTPWKPSLMLGTRDQDELGRK